MFLAVSRSCRTNNGPLENPVSPMVRLRNSGQRTESQTPFGLDSKKETFYKPVLNNRKVN